MAKGKGAIQGWITKNGVHIPIYGTYTVRGGVEPKAKGARWKKRFSAEGVKKALNRNHDSDSNETWYEGKINGQDVRITQETAGSNKFWNVDIGKPGDRHKLLTDNNEPMSFKSLEDAHDEIAHELNSKSGQEKEKQPKRGMTNEELDTANRELDARDEAEHLKKGEEQYDKAVAEGATVKKDKYADRDWNKDVDDAKRYGYSEQSEEEKQLQQYNGWIKDGKNRLTSGSVSGKDRQYLEEDVEKWETQAGELRQHLERAGKSKDEKEAKTIEVNGKKINVRPGENNSQAIYRQAMEDQGKSVDKQFYDELVSDSKQESSTPIGLRDNRKSLAEAAKAYQEDPWVAAREGWGNGYFQEVQEYMNSQKNSKSQASSVSSFSPESSAQTINDMQRRRANGGGTKDDWKTAQSVLESAPAGTTMIQTGNRGVKFQYTKGEDGKWHSTSGEEYTKDSKTLSMSWVGQSGPSVEFTTSDKALTKDQIKDSHTAAVNGRLNQHLAIDNNDRSIGNRSVPKVDNSLTPQSVKEQTKRDVQAKLESNYAKVKKATSSGTEKVTATPKSYSDMTLSGLKEALAGARPGDKTKIRAELRKRGYTYIGGKWVKGSKS